MQQDAIPLTSNAHASFDIKAFKTLYHHFDAQLLDKLADFYHPSAIFIDPIHRIEGLKKIEHYFEAFCSADLQCSFNFVSETVSKSANGEETAFLQWHMHYSHPRLAGGKNLTLEGASFLKFDTKILIHQDYYDMGAMVYQHIPVLGWLVKKINHELAGDTQ